MDQDTASALGLTQRRAASAQQQQQPAVHRSSSSSGSSGARTGPKTWVIWMLFGLGWPSLLFFGLSLMPRISSTVEWWLLMSGWLFLGSWWGGTAAGSLAEGGSTALSFRQRQAWRACVSVTLFGTSVGMLLLTAYAYRNWHLLQMAPLAIAVCIVVYSWLNPAPCAPQADDEAESKVRLAAQAAAAAAGTEETATPDEQQLEG